MKHKLGLHSCLVLKNFDKTKEVLRSSLSVLIQWLCATACGIAFSEIVLPALLLCHMVVTNLKALEHRAASS